jgi:hypothetical protein
MGFYQMVLAAFLLFALSALGLGIGLIFRRKPLSGSCGGVDADGKPLADCLCEKAREAAALEGVRAPTEPACEYEA